MLKNSRSFRLTSFFSGICICCLIFVQCKKQEDRSSSGLSHEDVVSLEQNSVFSSETLVYDGIFKGNYEGEQIVLVLRKNNKYRLEYRNKEYQGEWVKTDEGALMELDTKKNNLPFQFFRWSDNSEIMILNSNGMADDKGENYLTRIEN